MLTIARLLRVLESNKNKQSYTPTRSFYEVGLCLISSHQHSLQSIQPGLPLVGLMGLSYLWLKSDSTRGLVEQNPLLFLTICGITFSNLTVRDNS